MPTISFEVQPYKLGDWAILRLPKTVSVQLPSRGLAMVKGTINGHDFQTALEPDGMGSHWFRLDDNLLKSTGPGAGDTVKLAIESTKEWTEPDIPTDISKSLVADPKAYDTWTDITPMARWEWIRWIRATNNPDTRAKHIDVARSKLAKGMRRPCCFNTAMCTEPSVSKGGVLLDPT